MGVMGLDAVAGRRRRLAIAACVGALTAGLLAVLGGASPAAAAYWDNVAAAGEHSLVVLPVYWTTPDDQTPASLRVLARKTGDYWAEQTNGVITVPDARISVRDWMQIDDPGGCDKEAIFYAALAAGNEHAGSYHKHVIVYFPQTAYCTWKGSASVYPDLEGNIYHQLYGWIWINGYTSGDVWEREFGRNLGLGHARAAKCTTAGAQVPLSSSCVMPEDSDYDVMAADRGHDGFALNGALADRIGLLDPARTRTANVGDAYTLVPVGTPTGVSTVTVELPPDLQYLDGSTLYFEYRPSAGRHVAQPPGWSGVQVRQRGKHDYNSRLLALTPDGADGFLAHAAATVGVGWRIPGTYLEFVVDSQDPAGAQVRFASLPDSTPPPAPAAPTPIGLASLSAAAQEAGVIGGEIGISWPAVVDPESGIASYTIHLDGQVLRTVPGTATGALLGELDPGLHHVRLDVTNNAAMTTPGPEAAFTTAAAPPVPEPPTVTAATSGWMLSGDIELNWLAVADPDLVGYQVFVDEVLVSTLGTGTRHHQVDGLGSGYHSARVVALNAGGLGSSSAPTGFQVDGSAPLPPSAPTVTADAQVRGFVRGDLQVSWPSVSDVESGIDGYRVYVDDVLVAAPANAGHPLSVGVLPAGTHRLRVDVVNGAGLIATGATTTVRVDVSAPVLSGPSLGLRTGSTAAGIPVIVTSTAADTESGTCAVVTRVDGRPVGAGSSVATIVPAGPAVAVQVTATDCLGNVTDVTRTVSVVAVAESAGRYSRGWVVRRSAGYAGGTARVARRRGAAVVHTFTGSQVAITGSRSPRSGSATVYLDGKRVAKVDTRGPIASRQVLWATGTSPGRHTLKVVVNGTGRRPAVTLDSFLAVR